MVKLLVLVLALSSAVGNGANVSSVRAQRLESKVGAKVIGSLDHLVYVLPNQITISESIQGCTVRGNGLAVSTVGTYYAVEHFQDIVSEWRRGRSSSFGCPSDKPDFCAAYYRVSWHEATVSASRARRQGTGVLDSPEKRQNIKHTLEGIDG